MSEIECYVCENETVDGDSLNCGGVYNRRMHAKCVGINKTVLKAYMELDNLFYMCNECINNSMRAINSKLGKIMSVITIYDERVTRYEKDMIVLKDGVDELKMCVNKNNDETVAMSKMNTQCIPVKERTYAEKVKQNDPVILVVPKQDQTVQVTQKDVMNLMDPTEIPIGKMRNATKGTNVFEGRNKEDLDTIRRYAEEKLGSSYDVKLSELRKPKIIVSGLSEKMSDEEIVTKLKKQNEVIQDSELRVVSIFGKHKLNVVIEIDSDSFNKIMTGECKKLNIGWSSCMVKEYVNVLNCFKCQGFNHKAKDCTKTRACKKCAGEHDVSECRSKVTRCTNCIQANQKLNLNLHTNHVARSEKCKVMERRINFSKKRIEFNALNAKR